MTFQDFDEAGPVDLSTIDWAEVHDFALDQARRFRGKYPLTPEDCEDIAQWVVKKLYSKNLAIRHWRGYVYTMVKNHAIDIIGTKDFKASANAVPEAGDYAWRSVRTIFNTPIQTVKPRDVAYDILDSELFLEVMTEIPSDKRELFIDHLEGMTNNELAEIYGYASAAVVAQTISRIKRNLREKFSQLTENSD